jgi:hypothetical protein
MAHIQLYMPNCGQDGVIIAERNYAERVEFRGRPYHLWDIGEDTPMFHLHCLLKNVNISQLHCGQIETITQWHQEWSAVNNLFQRAIDNTA